MKQFLKNQYVVYRTGPDGRRFSWGLVTSETDKDCQGINEKGLPYSEDDDSRFDIRKRDVVAVLGRNPAFGAAYGCSIEPFVRTVESSAWGSLHFFCKMEDSDRDALKSGLARVHKKLSHHGLQGFLPIDIEIRNAKGKYAGSYRHTTSPDARDRMVLHPKLWENTPYLVGHESGHGVWYRLLTNKQQARWITLYHSYLTVTDCDSSVVKTLRDDFCGQSGEHVRDFRGQLDEDTAPVFDLCIDHITTYHGLSVQNIDKLVDAENASALRTMWPTSKVLRTDYEYPVSEYAMTKPEEFFAESFAFWLLGTKLPKRISSLMSEHMQRVAGRKS